MALNGKNLIALGFEDAALWKQKKGQLAVVGHKSARWRWIGARPDTLYAFSCNDRVLFIDISSSTLSKCLRHFSYPDGSTKLYSKINASLNRLLVSGKDVSILVLAEPPPLFWGGFHISLAAGLQRSLIEAFRPAWNDTSW